MTLKDKNIMGGGSGKELGFIQMYGASQIST